MDGAFFGKRMEGAIIKVLAQHNFTYKVANDVYVAIRNVMRSCLRGEKGFQIYMTKRVCAYVRDNELVRCVSTIVHSYLEGCGLAIPNDDNWFAFTFETHGDDKSRFKTKWKKRRKVYL